MNVDGFVVASYDAALSQRSSHTARGAESLPELPPEEEAGGGGGRRWEEEEKEWLCLPRSLGLQRRRRRSI